MRVDLNGKAALVTGAARGIGRAIALRFAENGAEVAINDIDRSSGPLVAEEVQKLRRRSLFVDADVGDRQAVDAMVARVVEAFGRLDILVNNAGINLAAEERAPVQEFSDEKWRRILRTDLDGVFYCSRSAAQQMIRQGGGVIINIASVAGLVPLRLQTSFVAAKAAVVNLTRSMALELAPHGVRVNAIAPGSILTEGTKALFYSDPERTKRILASIPLKRPGDPDDVAYAALYLASPEAGYVTGSTLVVDGGWTAGYIRDW
ncbi:MAG: 3-oxoacyl-ACP reductase family protein [Candidatus Bathyarchaeia archaeon]